MTNIVVSSGVTSTGLTFAFGTRNSVLSGGTLVSSTESPGASVNVSSGGTASALVVSGAGLLVWGSTQNTLLHSGSTEYVSSGGVATGTIVSAGGFQTTKSGGLALSTVLSGGAAWISGLALSTTVLSGGTAQIYGGSGSNIAISSGGAEYVFSGQTVSGTVFKGGFLYVSSGGLVPNSATFTTLSGGTEIVDSSTDIFATVDSGGTLIMLDATAVASSTLVNSGGVLVISAGGSAVGATVSAGGAIDMAFLPYSGGTTGSFNSGSHLLTVTEGGTSATLTLAGSYAGEAFHLTSGAAGGTLITVTPCFATGTRIATPDGATAIEALSAGERVLNAEGEALAIKWLGHRQVNCAAHPSPDDVWPVRIRAHAFAAGQPSRDLLVSPEHALFVDGFLMPARALLNGATITQERVAQVSYWHLELASHDVILAEGLPAESYLDTGNRGAFANAGPSLQLHPRFGRNVHTALACAPFADAGPHVALARARLLDRARLLGFAPSEGAWWVEADGTALTRAGDGAWIVPAGAQAVRLRSPFWRPMDIEKGNADTRCVGVCVAGITIDGTEIALDDPRLEGGFHPPETDGMGVWRWTDGNGVLPGTLFTAGQGSRLVLAVTRAPLVWRKPDDAPSQVKARLGS